MPVPNEQQFPTPPWKLHGDAIFALRVVPESAASSLVPSDARIFCIWPGRTLAVLYLARYDHTPVGEYSELIISPALIRLGNRIGFWISQISVDSDRSIAAGRSLWSLPKQRASFRWQTAPKTVVHTDTAGLSVRAELVKPKARLHLPFLGAALSQYEGPATWFAVRGEARIAAARATIEVSGKPELAALGFSGTHRVFVTDDMRMTIGLPRHQ